MNVQCTATVRHRLIGGGGAQRCGPNRDCRTRRRRPSARVFIIIVVGIFFWSALGRPPHYRTAAPTATRRTADTSSYRRIHRLSCVRAPYVYLHHSSVGTVAVAAAVPNPNPFSAHTRARRRRSTTVSVTKRIHCERVALSTSRVFVCACVRRSSVYIYIYIS